MNPNPGREVQQTRLLEILRRHVEPDDAKLSDHELVVAALRRYEKWRGVPLIDPNE